MKKISPLRLVLILLLLIAAGIATILVLPGYPSRRGGTEDPPVFVPLSPVSGEDADPDRRVLIARGDWGYPPFEYIDDTGKPQGFNVDILMGMAEIMDIELSIDLGPWDEVRSQLEQGEIDLLIGMYRTPERDRSVDFTIPHFIASYGVFVSEDSGITSIDQISDKKILVQKGDLGHDYLLEQDIGRQLVVLRDWEDLLPALKAGKADCAVLGMVQGLRSIEEKGVQGIRILSSPLLQQPYCIAVGEGDARLLALLNEGLNLLKTSGEYTEIYEKWFGISQNFTVSSNRTLIILLSGILFLTAVLAASILWSRMLRKEVEKKTSELRAANDELEKANEIKNRFLARVSHELRTPLHGIIGMSRLLQKGRLNQGQHHLVGMMQTAAGQLYRILSDLLDITRLREEAFSLHPTVFCLSQIQEWLEPILREATTEKGLEFSFLCSGADQELYSDRERLSQIVLNLADNAVKNTEQGSVRVELSYREGQLIIEVSDTGSGIPPEMRKDVFSPFTQLEKSQTTPSGLGLGLSIVKSITEMMKGMIRIEGSPGMGTTIRIVIPIPESEGSSAREEALPGTLPGTPAGGGERDLPIETIPPAGEVLLTEDEAINRLYIESLLRDGAWRYSSAADGEKALEMASQKVYAFILMDLSMPKMGGLEVTRKLRKIEEETGRTRTPVIALTAHAYEQTRKDCLQAGMDGFISKPFNEKDFWSEIERVRKREPL